SHFGQGTPTHRPAPFLVVLARKRVRVTHGTKRRGRDGEQTHPRLSTVPRLIERITHLPTQEQKEGGGGKQRELDSSADLVADVGGTRERRGGNQTSPPGRSNRPLLD
ncbi:unnamed protein product, partial [Ectocarpus sp. 6 AP-2014]